MGQRHDVEYPAAGILDHYCRLGVRHDREAQA
jgi:hypothetical protein